LAELRDYLGFNCRDEKWRFTPSNRPHVALHGSRELRKDPAVGRTSGPHQIFRYQAERKTGGARRKVPAAKYIYLHYCRSISRKIRDPSRTYIHNESTRSKAVNIKEGAVMALHGSSIVLTFSGRYSRNSNSFVVSNYTVCVISERLEGIAT
jgi:hypothetical protein